MKCARCSAELPSQSQFCLRCGTPVSGPGAAAFAPQSAAFGQSAMAARRRSSAPYLAAIAALALIAAALAAMVYRSHLVQAAGTSNTAGLVQAPGQANSGPLVQSPGTAGAPQPVVQQPNETAPQPTDVMDYLAFLKGVEQRKQKLISDETAKALTVYANEKGQEANAATDDAAAKQFLPKINQGNVGFIQEWDDLSHYFNTRTAPPSCQELHDAYLVHLGKIEAMFAKLHNAMNQAQSDPGAALKALTEMQSSASGNADSSAALADQALAAVCDRYRLRKEFSVTTGSGGSGLLP